MATLTPPLKWHGGKHYLARRIVALFPPHTHYVEPFAGGLSVLLARDPEGVSEVANDLNERLTRFWLVLSSPKLFDRFARIASAIPFAQPFWERATNSAALTPPEGDDEIVEDAVSFFVHCRQSLAGRMKAFTSITRSRTRRGMNNEVSAWLSAVEGLPAVHERLKRVLILTKPALNVIRSEDGPKTLFYLDPPYMEESRTAKKVYRHEMSDEKKSNHQLHQELLEALAGIKGKFLLSGYPSELYDQHGKAHRWCARDFELPNHSAGGKKKRRMIERVWANYELPTVAKEQKTWVAKEQKT